MTENISPPLPGGYPDRRPPSAPVINDGADPKAVAKEQAAGVGQGAAAAGQHVAGVAKEQTAQVATEAGRQAKDLLTQAQGQAKQQAGAQQEKLVSGLRSLSEELGSMSTNAEQPGVASDLAKQAAERTGAVAGWLDGREPAAILDDVNTFARRRPGAFLAVAGGIGFLAGRLTRGLKAGADADAPTPTRPASPPQVAHVSGGYTDEASIALPPAATAGAYLREDR